MNDEQFENQLREVSLGMPDPEAKRRLMRLALSRARARRRGRVLRWAFAAATGLLIIINVAFERGHQQHTMALTGQAAPTIELQLHRISYREGLQQRQQMLFEILHENGDS